MSDGSSYTTEERVFMDRIAAGGGRVVSGRNGPEHRFLYRAQEVPYELFPVLADVSYPCVVSLQNMCPAFSQLYVIQFIRDGIRVNDIIYFSDRFEPGTGMNSWEIVREAVFDDDLMCHSVCRMMNALALGSRPLSGIFTASDILHDVHLFARIFKIDLSTVVDISGIFFMSIVAAKAETFVRNILLLCKNVENVASLFRKRNTPIMGGYSGGDTFYCGVVDCSGVLFLLSVALGYDPDSTGIRITTHVVGSVEPDQDEEAFYSGDDTDKDDDIDSETGI
jgi:hypothetical protein